MITDLTRRQWLQRSTQAAAALTLSAPGARLALAATSAPTRASSDPQRLIVVMLRGALDGLAAVPVPGDPAWEALRPQAATDAERFGAPLPLSGPYALHPALRTLHRWYGEGSVAVAHAVASPYRERSHFDAQQMLESGSNRPFEFDTGWLGRALLASDRRGLALSPALPLALRGAPSSTSWAPSHEQVQPDDLLARVSQLYAADAQLAPVYAQARELHQSAAMAEAGRGGRGLADLARQAGRFLAPDDGPNLAWLEASGWDTHTQQAARLARGLDGLDQALAALREGLGEARWAHSTVLVMTEFGRSAAMNGSEGTDHGTGGAAFIAGGRVAGGRVIADWPGLARSQLHEARDLRPTLDVRALMKPVLQRHLGLSTAAIERDVLPGAPRGLADLWHS
ncbi:MAG: hypothetical protein RJA98_134 [Pseudomonadota bacterium]